MPSDHSRSFGTFERVNTPSPDLPSTVGALDLGVVQPRPDPRLVPRAAARAPRNGRAVRTAPARHGCVRVETLRKNNIFQFSMTYAMTRAASDPNVSTLVEPHHAPSPTAGTRKTAAHSAPLPFRGKPAPARIGMGSPNRGGGNGGRRAQGDAYQPLTDKENVAVCIASVWLVSHSKDCSNEECPSVRLGNARRKQSLVFACHVCAYHRRGTCTHTVFISACRCFSPPHSRLRTALSAVQSTRRWTRFRVCQSLSAAPTMSSTFRKSRGAPQVNDSSIYLIVSCFVY